jgi:hypothetical protein
MHFVEFDFLLVKAKCCCNLSIAKLRVKMTHKILETEVRKNRGDDALS